MNPIHGNKLHARIAHIETRLRRRIAQGDDPGGEDGTYYQDDLQGDLITRLAEGIESALFHALVLDKAYGERVDAEHLGLLENIFTASAALADLLKDLSGAKPLAMENSASLDAAMPVQFQQNPITANIKKLQKRLGRVG